MALRIPAASLIRLVPLRAARGCELRARAMSLKVNDSLPDVEVYEGSPGNKISLKDVFKGKKGVLFGVPGAFTPGCSKFFLIIRVWTRCSWIICYILLGLDSCHPRSRSLVCAARYIKTHLPGYVEKSEELKAQGIAVVACLSVNDVFVMTEWGKLHGAQDKVLMLADPNGAFSKATGLGIDKAELLALFGTQRSKRFAMVIDNGIVKSLNVEPDGTGLTCSLAASVLSVL
uniref:Peroxiredoxin-5 n=1 Tax=Leptobrachium leishanense TaxID=445787 RepID=A0A8C5WIN3_9ANUR